MIGSTSTFVVQIDATSQGLRTCGRRLLRTLAALNEDRTLLELFLSELIDAKRPVAVKTLSVLEQRFPREAEPSDEIELDRRGIPDGWIFDADWHDFIETKILAVLQAAQIESHRGTAERVGFRSVIAVSITPRRSTPTLTGTIHLEWRMVYALLPSDASTSMWAKLAADFLESAKAKLIDTEQSDADFNALPPGEQGELHVRRMPVSPGTACFAPSISRAWMRRATLTAVESIFNQIDLEIAITNHRAVAQTAIAPLPSRMLRLSANRNLVRTLLQNERLLGVRKLCILH